VAYAAERFLALAILTSSITDHPRLPSCFLRSPFHIQSEEQFKNLVSAEDHYEWSGTHRMLPPFLFLEEPEFRQEESARHGSNPCYAEVLSIFPVDKS